MIGRILLAVASLVVLAAIAHADGYLDAPKPSAKTTSGNGPRLLLREVYDVDGKRVGLDESTDRPATKTQAVPAKEATAQARPKYVQDSVGQWWKQWADGSWEYCTECNQGAVNGGSMGAQWVLPAEIKYTQPTQTYEVVPLMYATPTYYQLPRSRRAAAGWSAGFAAGACVGGT